MAKKVITSDRYLADQTDLFKCLLGEYVYRAGLGKLEIIKNPVLKRNKFNSYYKRSHNFFGSKVKLNLIKEGLYLNKKISSEVCLFDPPVGLCVLTRKGSYRWGLEKNSISNEYIHLGDLIFSIWMNNLSVAILYQYSNHALNKENKGEIKKSILDLNLKLGKSLKVDSVIFFKDCLFYIIFNMENKKHHKKFNNIINDQLNLNIRTVKG